MAAINTYICDGCGATRGEANHWWMLAVPPIEGVPTPLVFQVRVWTEGDTDDYQHYCGERCLTQAISELLSGAYSRKWGYHTSYPLPGGAHAS